MNASPRVHIVALKNDLKQASKKSVPAQMVQIVKSHSRSVGPVTDFGELATFSMESLDPLNFTTDWLAWLGA